MLSKRTPDDIAVTFITACDQKFRSNPKFASDFQSTMSPDELRQAIAQNLDAQIARFETALGRNSISGEAGKTCLRLAELYAEVASRRFTSKQVQSQLGIPPVEKELLDEIEKAGAPNLAMVLSRN